jgi:hypothetical protein
MCRQCIAAVSALNGKFMQVACSLLSSFLQHFSRCDALVDTYVGPGAPGPRAAAGRPGRPTATAMLALPGDIGVRFNAPFQRLDSNL